MAYDEKLAQRIRDLFIGERNIVERKMFGGLAFMLNQHMCCGIADNKFMGRIGAEQYQKALNRKHVTPMDFTGRPLTGIIYVLPEGIKTRRQLAGWIDQCVSYVETLPPKKKKKSNRRPIVRKPKKKRSLKK